MIDGGLYLLFLLALGFLLDWIWDWDVQGSLYQLRPAAEGSLGTSTHISGVNQSKSTNQTLLGKCSVVRYLQQHIHLCNDLWEVF